MVLSNDNTIYQYEWDVATEPVLVAKYALMEGSEVEQILLDNHLVLVQARSLVND